MDAERYLNLWRGHNLLNGAAGPERMRGLLAAIASPARRRRARRRPLRLPCMDGDGGEVIEERDLTRVDLLPRCRQVEELGAVDLGELGLLARLRRSAIERAVGHDGFFVVFV